MKKMYKIATVLLAFCFLLGSVPMSVKAAVSRDPFPELQVW